MCAGTTKRDDRYCLRTGVNDSGTTSRKLLSTHRRGRGWWCAQAHRITGRWLLSTHRRERQWNNESKVTIRAPAWTRVVVCAGTPNNASMVTVYAPAGTTVVVCAGTPHNTLRVTIHAPAWTKVTIHAPAWTRVVVCAGTPNNASMVTVYAPAGTAVEQRVESYYPRTGVDEGGSVRRHTA